MSSSGGCLGLNEIDAPDTLIVRDTTDISWTVTNQGASDALANNWYDVVYLSRDATLDDDDQRLPAISNSGFDRPAAVSGVRWGSICR